MSDLQTFLKNVSTPVLEPYVNMAPYFVNIYIFIAKGLKAGLNYTTYNSTTTTRSRIPFSEI